MTECTQETFGFTAHFSRRVEAGFTAGQVSSDGGAALLREVDRKINLLARLAGCFLDGRDPERIQHTVDEMLSQRIFGLALGYEDLMTTSSCAPIRCWRCSAASTIWMNHWPARVL